LKDGNINIYKDPLLFNEEAEELNKDVE